MFGFKDANHYYDTISCVGRLNKIKVPSFFLMSKDDFLFDHKIIPSEEIKLSENIILGTTDFGSHICFFEGVLFPRNWFVKPFLLYLNYFETNI